MFKYFIKIFLYLWKPKLCQSEMKDFQNQSTNVVFHIFFGIFLQEKQVHVLEGVYCTCLLFLVHIKIWSFHLLDVSLFNLNFDHTCIVLIYS